MTTKITIDPAIVSDVLEIEHKLKEMECDCGVEIDVLDTFICIRGCDHIADSGFGIEGMYENEDGDYTIDIHRFKDMAIEWCAGKGYPIRVEYYYHVPLKYQLDGEAWVIGKGINTPFCWGEESDYLDKLSAELAAISFVWEQIQKEEKDEHN